MLVVSEKYKNIFICLLRGWLREGTIITREGEKLVLFRVFHCEVFDGFPGSHHTFRKRKINLVKWLIRVLVAYHESDIYWLKN